MANKSGDSSLHDWFGKSKSSDGKPGWVQLGGKYAGKPCAKQPGQTTKPKCGSSKMKRALSKDEEEAAFRRKNKKDPNPNRSGKAINVATEETVNEAKGEKDACYHKVKSRYKVWPSAYASGALVKCRKVGADSWGNKTKKEGFTPSQIAALESIGAIEINEAGKKCWKGYKKVGTQKLFGKTYNRCEKEEVENVSGQTDSPPITEAVTIPRENGQLMRVFLTFRGKFYMMQLFFPSLSIPSKQEVTDAVQKIYPDARVTQYMKSTVDPNQPLIRVSEQTEQEDKQKQAIERKQLVLNRQKLQLQQKAVQKGGKTDMHMQEESDSEKKYCRLCKKKETKSQCGYGPKMWEKYSVDDAKARLLAKAKAKRAMKEGVLDDALKTDKKMGELHKKVDNDVKRMKAGKKFKEEFENVDEIFMSAPAPKKQDPKKNQKKETWYDRDERKRKERKEEVEHLGEMPYQVYGSPDGKKEKKIGKPVKSKKYADARAAELADTHKKTGGKYRYEYTEEAAAWTRKAGKNKEGGLNEKGRKSYERENPGSDLKAPSKKVGNPRRASFCARMRGMRKRQKPSNNTGEDRLSKSLRAWNC